MTEKERKEPLGDEAAIACMKRQQGYRAAEVCCKTCPHFGQSTEMGGSPQSRPERCELGPFWFRVEEAGCCEHHPALKPTEDTPGEFEAGEGQRRA